MFKREKGSANPFRIHDLLPESDFLDFTQSIKRAMVENFLAHRMEMSQRHTNRADNKSNAETKYNEKDYLYKLFESNVSKDVDDYKENISSQKENVEDASENQTEKKEEEQDKKSDAIEDEAKKLKRKLKKQRQKERKRIEKLGTNDDSNNAKQACGNNEDITESETQDDNGDTKEDKTADDSTKESELHVSRSDKDEKISVKDDLCSTNKVKQVEEIDENEEFEFIDNAAAFVSKALKKGNKKPTNTKDKANAKATSMENLSGTSQECNTIGNNCTESHSDNDNESFTFVKGKHKQIYSAREMSESLGMKAIALIMQDRMPTAVKLLSQAIDLEPDCVYHYINRAFCYLRSEQYPLAIENAQFAILNCQEHETLLKAKYILSQGFLGIKDYEDAEKVLEECLYLASNDIYFKRELTRLRITQLTNLGFSEEDAIHAVKNSNSLSDMIDMLVGSNTDAGNHPKTDSIFDENEIYCSDDSEDENSLAL